MKPEVSEIFLINELFEKSVENNSDMITGTVVDIEKLTGDASTRRYYRVFTDKNNFVACLDHPLDDGSKNDFLVLQEVLDENKVRVPRIYDYDTSKGYILEEDLGDSTLLTWLTSQGDYSVEYDSYEKAILQIENFQAIKLERYNDFSFTSRFFDYQKYLDEYKFSEKYFLKMFCNEESSKIVTRIAKEFNNLNVEISNLDKVFVHRDYHSRNIMLHHGEQVIIDFQDARVGPKEYDLVSLLEDAYYKLEAGNKAKLKEQFWENCYRQISRDEFERRYCMMAIQRIFKALGTFSYIYYARKDQRYLKYIGYCFENLRQFLIEYENRDLRKMLCRSYYEN